MRQLRDDLGDLRGAGAELAAQSRLVHPPDVGPDGLHPRPVGGRATRLPATAPQHRRSLRLRRAGEFVGQPALPDARLTGEQEQAPMPRHGFVEAPAQLAHFALAADEPTPRTALESASVGGW